MCGKWVTLRLLGVGAAPGVREAFATLLSASSVAGPGGWRLGWPGQQLGQSGSIPWAALAPYVAVLAPEPGQCGEALQVSQCASLDMQEAATCSSTLYACLGACCQAGVRPSSNGRAGCNWK